MFKQLINPATGEFTINNEFIVSNTTTIEQLKTHFGHVQMQVSDMKNGYINYRIHNLKIDGYYFIITFHFLNSAIIQISFVLRDKPYDGNAGWDDFNEQEQVKEGEFMKQWMAKQMNRDFKTYDWGKMETNYDFHNLSTSCAITYKKNNYLK
jgi:hypothetical protein